MSSIPQLLKYRTEISRKKNTNTSRVGTNIIKQLNEISRNIRAHKSGEKRDEPMEDVGQESLCKSMPNKPENFTNEPATVEICRRDTASIDVPTKKDPVDGVVAANEFAGSEVKTCVKKKVPEESPKEESKNGGTKTDTFIIFVLFPAGVNLHKKF